MHESHVNLHNNADNNTLVEELHNDNNNEGDLRLIIHWQKSKAKERNVIFKLK